MEPARVGADDLSHGGSEGDDVMPNFGLDFMDAFDLEVCPVTDGLGGLLRDQASLGKSLGSGHLDGQPAAKPVLIAPDTPHVGAGITRDHSRILLLAQNLRNGGL